MSGDDDLAARMRQLAAEFAEDETFELDDELVSRLLRGDAGAGDTPPEYAEVADVLAAAAVPPRPAELRGEAAVLAAFRAVHDEASMIAPGRPNRLRRSVLTPLAAATATAVVLGSGLAAATAPSSGATSRTRDSGRLGVTRSSSRRRHSPRRFVQAGDRAIADQCTNACAAPADKPVTAHESQPC
jgi:hypothetical protein